MSEPTPPSAEPADPPAAAPSSQTMTDTTVPVPTAPVAPGSPVAPDPSASTPLTPPGPAANSYQLPPPGPTSPAGPVFPAAYAAPAAAGTSGVAIAALVCGIAGFVPLVGVVAIVLGIVALSQVRARGQQGRGLAVAGIVLGSLWVLLWAALLAVGVMSVPRSGAENGVVTMDRTLFDELKPGDCFDGLPEETDAYIEEVTTKACSQPHEAQIATTLTLPAGTWPGEEKAADMASDACGNAVDPLIRDDRYDDVDLSFVYPSTAFEWRTNRSVTCILEGLDGPLTGSVLRAG